MRKLAILAAAALLASTAAAEQQLPEIYGRLRLALNHMDNGEDSVVNVSDNSSRIGLRGGVELAPGLRGEYQLEAGFNADEGGQFKLRTTYAGVVSQFGTLRAGYMNSPVKSIRSKVDLFGGQVGANGNIVRRGTLPNFDNREKNMLYYASPSMAGAKLELAYTTNVDSGSADPGKSNDSYMAAASYTGLENLYVALGYQVYGKDAYAESDNNKSSIIRLGATYSIGQLKLAGLAQRMSDVSTSPATDDWGYNQQFNDSVKGYGIGAAYRLGKTTLKAQYYLLNAAADDADADMISLGVDYHLTEQFMTYIVYSRLDNDDNSYLVPYRNHISDPLQPVAATGGETTQGLGIGVAYNF